MTTRYAVYFVPNADDPWWDFGCSWLGRNAATDESVAQPMVDGITPERLWALTQSPRRYGFHATLKAPFALSATQTEDGLLEAIDRFCSHRQAVLLRDLQVSVTDRVVSLRPAQPSMEINELAFDCVRTFDPFRAPLQETERARRVATGLSSEQTKLLERWGYPFVDGQYRFHLTLSGQVDGREGDALCNALYGMLREQGLRNLLVDNLVLCTEPGPGEAFRIVRRFPLCG